MFNLFVKGGFIDKALASAPSYLIPTWLIPTLIALIYKINLISILIFFLLGIIYNKKRIPLFWSFVFLSWCIWPYLTTPFGLVFLFEEIGEHLVWSITYVCCAFILFFNLIYYYTILLLRQTALSSLGNHACNIWCQPVTTFNIVHIRRRYVHTYWIQ